MQDYWQQQTKDKSLFPDLLWSRPENKIQAGKLLIIGGNAHGFSAAAEAFTESAKAGIGSSRVLLPDSLQKTVGLALEGGEYAPSTPSGSFAKQALGAFLAHGEWSDASLVAGDLGRNSETAILLEQFIDKYKGPLTLAKDAVDYFTKAPLNLVNRPSTLLVVSMAQLQKIGIGAKLTKAFTFDMDLLRLVDNLHEFTKDYPMSIIIKHLDNILVAHGGRVSSTKIAEELPIWRVKVAASATVWWLQNTNQTFEALTSSLINI
jgi:hypothetical protein